ncbi:hypothetical protein ON010_g8447 [Phytophthora cinnamomi]|nr:hypothetical protein ON010_g8447 [Phytophthora cinnamomi]
MVSRAPASAGASASRRGSSSHAQRRLDTCLSCFNCHPSEHPAGNADAELGNGYPGKVSAKFATVWAAQIGVSSSGRAEPHRGGMNTSVSLAPAVGMDRRDKIDGSLHKTPALPCP